MNVFKPEPKWSRTVLNGIFTTLLRTFNDSEIIFDTHCQKCRILTRQISENSDKTGRFSQNNIFVEKIAFFVQKT